ncbi:MAG: MFS transporter [Marinicaulis sp.]|nr:MFS transporter [Marinicaulis sp.]NNL88889.1 MFS transporter [Marinicaulis sp.]
MGANKNWLDPAFEAIAIDDHGRVCKEIPESACQEEAGNFFTHVSALSLSKSADALIDPKLVLSWLLTHLGAPAAAIGLLVPVREAGALLPQLFTAAGLRRLPLRKFAWSAGAAAQGAASIAIAFVALTMTGAAAGWLILFLLALLAIARSICSVTYKDVLGKTIDKSRRGAATGLAGSTASVTAIVFALLLTSGIAPRETLAPIAIMIAGACWVAAAVFFLSLTEEKGAVDGGANAFSEAVKHFNYLKSEPQLRRFILARGLLTATALAPPFMVAAASKQGAAYSQLGLLVLASAAASLASSFIWGKLSDRSSRRVLFFASIGGACALAAAAVFGAAGNLGHSLALPIILFALMIAYQGVRLGRSTHLVDMATEETRGAYTALSNTVIGLLLLAGGIFGVIASIIGAAGVLGVMAIMCGLAAPIAYGLDDVQNC